MSKQRLSGALLGAVIASGVSPDLGIISDGAGQFRLLVHGLCWVHAERLINKLIPFTELGVSFWEYLTDRVAGKKLIPTLGKLIAQKAKVSLGDLAETVSLSLA